MEGTSFFRHYPLRGYVGTEEREAITTSKFMNTFCERNTFEANLILNRYRCSILRYYKTTI